MNCVVDKEAESPPQSGPLVYVVDDEPLVLELVAAILGPAGYRVITFREPQSALRSFRGAKAKPALLVTDFALQSSMTGLELLAECRRIRPDQKALLVTGTVNEQTLAAAECKPDGFLAKPFKPADFIKKVRLLAISAS